MSPLAAERAVDTENFICAEGRRGNRCGEGKRKTEQPEQQREDGNGERKRKIANKGIG